jgi:very-short-patch-repair endonuclease
VRYRGVSRELIESAGNHRNAPTRAEEALWGAIRRRQVEGARFRRQHPLGKFIVDFCCPEHRLVIEVDGPTHEEQVEYDAGRADHLNAYGYRVLRFSNEQVLKDLDVVVSEIQRAVLNCRAPLPPTVGGKGLGVRGRYASQLAGS